MTLGNKCFVFRLHAGLWEIAAPFPQKLSSWFWSFPWQTSIIWRRGQLSLGHYTKPSIYIHKKFTLSMRYVDLENLCKHNCVFPHLAIEKDLLNNNSTPQCLSSVSWYSPRVVSCLSSRGREVYEVAKQQVCFLKSLIIVKRPGNPSTDGSALCQPCKSSNRLSTLILGRRRGSAVRNS